MLPAMGETTGAEERAAGLRNIAAKRRSSTKAGKNKRYKKKSPLHQTFLCFKSANSLTLCSIF